MKSRESMVKHCRQWVFTMADLIDSLPPADARLIRRMAEAANATPEAISREIIRAYLGLARGAPEALPRDPMASLCVSKAAGS
jgi:hypothetical protein